MKENMNLQDRILSECVNKRIPTTVFLMNGVQIRGLITGYDSFVVTIEADGKMQMVYKHAISTVIPLKPCKIPSGQ